jgi:tetratricopeptide (TPR) repeat protein
MGNHLLAIKDFDIAIKLDSNLSEAYFRRGFSKYFIKRYHDAIEDFKISKDKEDYLMEEDSNYEANPGIFDGLGCCYHALK